MRNNPETKVLGGQKREGMQVAQKSVPPFRVKLKCVTVNFLYMKVI